MIQILSVVEEGGVSEMVVGYAVPLLLGRKFTIFI